MGKCLFLRKGETHTAPLSGILANTLAVGSTVKLMENGTAVEYLVVHQGLPSSMYDASCDGMWLLRKNIHSRRAWHSSKSNIYASSTMHNYLNGDFFNLFGSVEQAAIKQVKIPYVNGTGSGGSIASGVSGLSTKIFLLGSYEVGWTTDDSPFSPIDGTNLSYFDIGSSSTAESKRIGYLNGTAEKWWFRSPTTHTTEGVLYATATGSYMGDACTNSRGCRPALILPSTAKFDKDTLILKGVA